MNRDDNFAPRRLYGQQYPNNYPVKYIPKLNSDEWDV
jgi:hypothetical protein